MVRLRAKARRVAKGRAASVVQLMMDSAWGEHQTVGTYVTLTTQQQVAISKQLQAAAPKGATFAANPDAMAIILCSNALNDSQIQTALRQLLRKLEYLPHKHLASYSCPCSLSFR